MKQLLSTREVAAYLGINEKMVYNLVTEKGLPGTKVTGKWLFPLHLVDAWLERNTLNHPGQPGDGETGQALVLAGSNDILLDRALRLFAQLHPGRLAAFVNLGSLGGLHALRDGLCHMATSHLMQAEGHEYNFDTAQRVLDEPPAVVNFCIREQGYLTAPGNPHGIADAGDIAARGLRVANRPHGTGTRLLFDAELTRHGVDPARVPGYGREFAGHIDVGMEIVAGRADVAPCIRAVAGLLGLGFVPLQRERCDLLVPRAGYFDKRVQLFIAMLGDPRFRSLTDDLDGYDLSKSGRVVFPGDAV